jgi:hypothetical protein
LYVNTNEDNGLNSDASASDTDNGEDDKVASHSRLKKGSQISRVKVNRRRLLNNSHDDTNDGERESESSAYRSSIYDDIKRSNKHPDRGGGIGTETTRTTLRATMGRLRIMKMKKIRVRMRMRCLPGRGSSSTIGSGG